jgi:aminoglycoside 6-adenylyltransferase
MRTEKEILYIVLDTAREDDAVRAVIRTDLLPIRKYLFSYQFCFIVDDIEKYDDDKTFETCFGKRVLLYRGDKNYPEMFPGAKAHLMVFEDGITLVINTMDKDTFLSRFNRENSYENVWIGDTYKKILDKDNILPEIERLEETQTIFADTPTKEIFDNTCNEFWWVMKTFAEYTLRKELPSAMFYLNVAVRDLLNKMLRWHIYLKSGKPVDISDESLDVKWVRRDEALDLVTFPLTKKRLENMLSACNAVSCFNFKKEPFEVVAEEKYTVGR